MIKISISFLLESLDITIKILIFGMILAKITIGKSNSVKAIILFILCSLSISKSFSQEKLPRTDLINILQHIDKFVINDAHKFAHIYLKPANYNTFLQYLIDSTAAPIQQAQNPVYYKWYLTDGTEVNGDIYFYERKAYMETIYYGKKYYNVYSIDGIDYLRNLFKF